MPLYTLRPFDSAEASEPFTAADRYDAVRHISLEIKEPLSLSDNGSAPAYLMSELADFVSYAWRDYDIKIYRMDV